MNTRVGRGVKGSSENLWGKEGNREMGTVSTELLVDSALNPLVVTALQGLACSTRRQCENVSGRCL